MNNKTIPEISDLYVIVKDTFNPVTFEVTSEQVSYKGAVAYSDLRKADAVLEELEKTAAPNEKYFIGTFKASYEISYGASKVSFQRMGREADDYGWSDRTIAKGYHHYSDALKDEKKYIESFGEYRTIQMEKYGKAPEWWIEAQIVAYGPYEDRFNKQEKHLTYVPPKAEGAKKTKKTKKKQ